MTEAIGRARPSPRSLLVLCALGATSALWALFLWAELVLLRRGGTPVCGFGEGDCGRAWDSGFASAVQRATGLPVAGWGLAWGLVALALPLLALTREAEGRPLPALVSAVRLAAGLGLFGVLALLTASAAEGVFCLGCFVSHLIVATYSGVALFSWRQVGLPDLPQGAIVLARALLAALALLLYPGLRTPLANDQRGLALSGPASSATGDPDPDRALASFVASLAPDQQQTVSDSLEIYRRSAPGSPRPPRALLGSPEAPVRITAFTDVRCEHCAELHQLLGALREDLPGDRFSVESRQFPLDRECNPLVEKKGDPFRCLAARALICLEGGEAAFGVTSALFASQRRLDRPGLLALASPYVPEAAFGACLDDPATRRKLDDDIGWASTFDPEGTPIVLVNGRRGTSFGPFLYAIVLAGGDAGRSAFRSLPPPRSAGSLR